MKPTLHPSLVNDVFGDPGLLVEFLLEKRAILFDLGDISAIPVSTLLKVSHVFVSHTHIDHFIGFDRMLRMQFGRGKTLYMYGPENFIDNVEGKLAGFTWNLVDKYEESLTIEAIEVREDHVLRARFPAIEKFKKSEVIREPLVDGLLLDEDFISVRTAVLEHRVPCLGYALEEKNRVNINKERLAEMNFTPDRWLAQLKENIYNEEPDDLQMSVSVGGNGVSELRKYSLGDLKKRLVEITEGQKIAYVVDTLYRKTQREKRRCLSSARIQKRPGGLARGNAGHRRHRRSRRFLKDGSKNPGNLGIHCLRRLAGKIERKKISRRQRHSGGALHH